LYNFTERRFWLPTKIPFSNTSDIIDQFNYFGFSDICIYPADNQVSRYKDPTDPATKGIKYVFGGFIQNNQTGTE